MCGSAWSVDKVSKGREKWAGQQVAGEVYTYLAEYAAHDLTLLTVGEERSGRPSVGKDLGCSVDITDPLRGTSFDVGKRCLGVDDIGPHLGLQIIICLVAELALRPQPRVFLLVLQELGQPPIEVSDLGLRCGLNGFRDVMRVISPEFG